MTNGKPRLTTIKNRRDFLAAVTGVKCVTPTLILQSKKRGDDHPVGQEPRIGFTVTKKNGNAVARNRIKRRLREAAHAIAPEIAVSGHDYVVIARPKALTCDFSEIRRDMAFAFSRITANKSPSTSPSGQP